jgi:hypothetical protein
MIEVQGGPLLEWKRPQVLVVGVMFEEGHPLTIESLDDGFGHGGLSTAGPTGQTDYELGVGSGRRPILVERLIHVLRIRDEIGPVADASGTLPQYRAVEDEGHRGYGIE